MCRHNSLLENSVHPVGPLWQRTLDTRARCPPTSPVGALPSAELALYPVTIISLSCEDGYMLSQVESSQQITKPWSGLEDPSTDAYTLGLSCLPG